MNRLDDALRDALKRQDPGEDFTRRVLERAAAMPRKRTWKHALRDLFHSPLRMATAGAMACALLVTSGAVYRHHQEEARGEAAKEQLVQALRFAGAKLHTVQAKVIERSE